MKKSEKSSASRGGILIFHLTEIPNLGQKISDMTARMLDRFSVSGYHQEKVKEIKD